PAQEFGPVAESPTGEVVVADLANQLRFQAVPVGGAGCAPAAGAAGRAASEAASANHGIQNSLQLEPLFGVKARGESHVIERAVVVIEAQQQRADAAPILSVAKASDHAFGRANAFDFDHGATLAAAVGFIELLGHDAIEAHDSNLGHPLLSLAAVFSRLRKTYNFCGRASAKRISPAVRAAPLAATPRLACRRHPLKDRST